MISDSFIVMWRSIVSLLYVNMIIPSPARVDTLLMELHGTPTGIFFSEFELINTEKGYVDPAQHEFQKHILGAVYKWCHPFLGHFRPPPPPCHHVIFWHISPPMMMSLMYNITKQIFEITSNHGKRMPDWGPLHLEQIFFNMNPRFLKMIHSVLFLAINSS